MESLSGSSNAVILDLNDDCFLQVFKYLYLEDLCAAADVCRRFRRNAQSHFALKSKKHILHIYCSFHSATIFLKPRRAMYIDKMKCIDCTGMSHYKHLLHVSQVLRIFGGSIKVIKLSERYDKEHVELHAKCKRIILDLISRYCSGTLSELSIDQCDLTGETETTMRPLLLHLKRLYINECKYSQSFEQMLSIFAPELQELQFSYDLRRPLRGPIYLHEMQFDGIWRQPFPKLTLISFRSIYAEIHHGIEEFLKLNPQLKKIGLVNCPNIHGTIFQSIVTHVPGIETMEIDRVSTIIDRNTFKYCGKLNCLNTLKLCTYGYKFENCPPVHHAFIPSILYEIHAAKIALQHLYVYGAGSEGEQSFKMTEELVDAISKFKTMKTLWLLKAGKLKMSHILGICGELRELLNLKLQRNEIIITADDLLKIIINLPKLQSLHYHEENNVFGKYKAATLAKNLRYRSFEDRCKFHMLFDTNPEMPDELRILNGVCILREAYPRMHGSQLTDDVLRIKSICEEYEESLSDDGGPGCVDAYMKMVQAVEQRQEKRHLLMELDEYSLIATKIPKHLIRKNNDILTLVVNKYCCSFFFDEIDVLNE